MVLQKAKRILFLVIMPIVSVHMHVHADQDIVENGDRLSTDNVEEASIEPFQDTPEQVPADNQEEQELPFVPAESEEATQGPDTVAPSLETIGVQGNWVKKRKWLEKSLDLNAQIQDDVVAMQAFRKTFSDKFSSINRELDQFYQTNGLVRGKLDDVFASIINYLEKNEKRQLKAYQKQVEQEELPSWSYEHKADQLTDTTKKLQRELEQFRLDVKSIEELDDSLKQRLKKLDEEIKNALDEAEQADKVSEEIWDIIDDTIAKDRYYTLVNLKEQSKARYTYISSDLSDDFDGVITKIKQQIARVNNAIENLEEQEIIVKSRQVRLKRLGAEREKRRADQEAEQNDKHRKKKIRTKKRSSWYDSFLGFFGSVRTALTSAFARPVRKKKSAKK